ncbi:hypothetical protein DZD18_13890 [Rhodobacteraceae bacterium W635]|uniref:endonuclease/exonuclease/phosphatase family protein n=1 Tax=Nioella halotolerans TaxID=2303578 RepID=UPI000E9B485B|nr:hypothetical protein DZD18_13890 [Rhodobacteraceae bacterium W635]
MLTRTRRQVMAGLMALTGAAGLPGCAASPVSRLPGPASPSDLRVASFNIRYLDLTRSGQDGGRSLAAWEARRAVVGAVLSAIGADIIAFQEMESWTGQPQAGPPLQRRWLSRHLPGYAVAAESCLDGRESGQPIFYRAVRFTPLEACVRDLGDAAGSAGAFAGYGDHVASARLRDRETGRPLTVLNLHLHFSDRLRRESGARMAAALARQAMAHGDDVIVLGDMNALARSRPMRVLALAGLTPVPASGASFHFNTGIHAFGAIDHVLHGPGFRALGPARILRARSGHVWPSDHYPVFADLGPA